MSNAKSIPTFIRDSETMLMEIFNTQHAYIYLVNEELSLLTKF